MTTIASLSCTGALTPKTQPKLTKVEKPNTREDYETVQKKREALGELFRKMTELNKKIQEHRSGQTGYTSRRNELRQSLDSVVSQITALDIEKSNILVAIEERQKQGREAKSKIQTLKRNLGFQSEKEIEDKICEIEKCILSTKMSVQKENQMIAKIQQLRQSKPLLYQYAHMEENANLQDQESIDAFRKRLDEIRDDIKEFQKKKRDLADTLYGVVKTHQEALAPLNELWEEKTQLKKQIALLRQEEVDLLQEIETKNREYQTQAIQIQKRVQQERLQTIRRRNLEEARELCHKKLSEIEEQEGWSPQYILAQQMLSYMKTLVKRAEDIMEKQGHAPQVTCTTESLAPDACVADGLRLLKPKHQREDDISCNLSKKKKNQRKNKKHASLSQPLVHDISVLADFERLNINPPLCLEECSSCLKTIENKLAVLEQEKSAMEESIVEKKREVLQKLQVIDLNLSPKSGVSPPVSNSTSDTLLSAANGADDACSVHFNAVLPQP